MVASPVLLCGVVTFVLCCVAVAMWPVRCCVCVVLLLIL